MSALGRSWRHAAVVFGLAFALIFGIFTWRLGASDALVPALAGSLGATLGWQLRNGRR